MILTARSTGKLNEAAVAIEKSGARADVFSCDLSQPGGAQNLHDEMKQSGLEVDLLINNAGYGRWGDFTEFGRDDDGRMIHLNITALTDLCHLFIPDMISREGGGVSIMTLCPGATDSNFRTVAASHISEDLGDPCASSTEVAEQGLDAFLKQKAYVIPGKGNGKFALLPRLLSRNRVLNLVGNTFGKRIRSVRELDLQNSQEIGGLQSNNILD